MDKNIHEALKLFEELAAENCLPARAYVVKINMALHALTNWQLLINALHTLCELAMRGYPPALYHLGW